MRVCILINVNNIKLNEKKHYVCVCNNAYNININSHAFFFF